MNGTVSIIPTTTTGTKGEEKGKWKKKGDWISKTDKSTRYEKCINCNEMVLDNWFMRHVNKCLSVNPNRERLLEEATRQHQDFKAAVDHAIEKPSELPMPIDVKLVQPTKKDQQTLNSFQKYTFKFGDIVEAVVTDIDKYNIAHVNCINGNPDKKGMIKNTKVRAGTVMDMHAHFRIGDKIRAEVNEVRVDGKLWLSTKRFPMPTYPLGPVSAPAMSPIAEKLSVVKEQIIVQPAPIKLEDKQFEEVITFVKSKIGIVSPEAKLKIKAMLDSKGMFAFMMALAKVADFQMDVGLLFASEIEKQMGSAP